MIVLDASAAVDFLLRTAPGRRITKRIWASDLTLHAPEVLDLEVIQVFRRQVRIGRLTAEAARARLDVLDRLDLHRHPHGALTPRIWALRDQVTAYDGAYIALAELLGAPLLTSDARLARSHGHTAVIELA